MPNYILLVNWTDQGIRNVKGTVERTDDVAKLAEKHGGRLVQSYWTVGPYDLVAITEAPADESATLRAYDREEMSRIIERLGPSPGA